MKPFVVQNLGKYERQAWQVAEFASDLKGHGFSRAERVAQENRRDDSQANHPAGTVKGVRIGAPEGAPLQSPNDALKQQREREAAYRKFILELYHATPVSGHVWLHGVKGGRMVHVGAVDAPVTRADVNAIAAEVWKSKSAEKPAVDILGWEFALELNETAKEVAAQARVDAAFKKIPREVLEKKAVEQGDVHFFELGALSVETKKLPYLWSKNAELRWQLHRLREQGIRALGGFGETRDSTRHGDAGGGICLHRGIQTSAEEVKYRGARTAIA